MNSMPADSSAFRSAVTVDPCAAIAPGFASSRLIVGNETDEARDKSCCSHRKRARAARISSLLSRKTGLPKLMPGELFNTSGIDRHLIRDTIPQVSSWRRSNRVDASYEKTVEHC